ncbi:MAG TPA: sugar ABC transporter ATP-binding protein [Treponemataceae bacterium]|nr:sugar ABC transporter ATP-binding protein [Treponemataceae bacterium]
MANETPLLRLESVTKDFSGTVVLQDVSFDLKRGEILGLVGENGAGKTTLMSILFGMPVISETGGYGGRIFVNGKEVHFSSPFDALDAGFGMVHQEFSLIPGFSATENIMLNREITKPGIISDIFGHRLSLLDRPTMKSRSVTAISKLGIEIDPEMKVAEMPIGHKQFIEIAREIDREKVSILVLDEPTAVLTESEADILLNSIKKLAATGIGVIFISHRLQEIVQVCDRVVTLRDGKTVRDINTKDTSIEDIAVSMVGREIDTSAKHDSERIFGEPILEVNKLWVDMPGEIVRNVSFSVRKGEIFGIGGLAGQGKLGIPNGIMSLYPSGGEVLFHGKSILSGDPMTPLREGLAFVSEDRRGVGLLLDESLEWNIAFTAMQTKNRYLRSFLGGLVRLRNEKAMKELAKKYIDMLEIKCTGSSQAAKELSGGNQQKICLAKAFCLEPEVLFVSEPTRGIDVGAKSIVLDVLRKYNKELGITIIMVSSELEELRSVCDRIAIVSHGEIAGILSPETSQSDFALYMAGLKNTANSQNSEAQ